MLRDMKRFLSLFGLLSCVMLMIGCGLKRPHQSGVASWYGPGFRGKPTASGETFRPYKMTAAHKQLPFGTVVRVVRVDDGRSVRVVVNDRGPFVAGRVIDLSKRAGKRIGLMEDGTTPVKIFVVGCRDRYGKCP